MDEKILKINTTTPMLSHGITTENAEVRIPEFKSAMRFWWRVLRYFEDIEKMREEEGKIFGDSRNSNGNYCASPIGMRLISNTKLNKESCNIYMGNKWEIKSCGICLNENFEISIYKRLNVGKELDYYINVLGLVSVLGGIGQRARRGYGCFYIEDEATKSIKSRQDVLVYVKERMKKLKINNYYNFLEDECRIKRIKPRDMKDMKIKYPFLKEVSIGEKCSRTEFFERIEKAIKEIEEKKLRYKKKGVRLASPIYVTCFSNSAEEVFPIICFLNNTNYCTEYNKYIRVFRSEVLCQKKS